MVREPIRHTRQPEFDFLWAGVIGATEACSVALCSGLREPSSESPEDAVCWVDVNGNGVMDFTDHFVFSVYSATCLVIVVGGGTSAGSRNLAITLTQQPWMMSCVSARN